LLLRAMRVLPQQQREVVALRYYEGMSTADTARTLGISPGTVKSTLHRALLRMRAELQRQGEGTAACPAAAAPRLPGARRAPAAAAAPRRRTADAGPRRVPEFAGECAA